MAFSTPSSNYLGTNGDAGAPSTVTISTTPNAGDLLFAGVMVRGQSIAPPIVAPSGFALADKVESADVVHLAYFKVSDGTESSLSWTNTDATSPSYIRAVVVVFPSAGGGTFIAPASKTINPTDSLTTALGPVTAESGDLVVSTAQIDSNTKVYNSWSNGFTEEVLARGFNPSLSIGYKISAGGSESTTGTLDESTRNGGMLMLFRESAPATASLDTVPVTAYPGETITLGVTGAEAVKGTGGVTINGVAQTVDSWSDTSIDITVVQGDTPYGTGNTITITTDSGGTDTGVIELVADTASGFGFVDMSSPNTTDESSVAFGATPTVVTGDQFEWEDFNTLGNLVIDDEGFVSSVDTEGTFRGRFWDATDSTWGATETFTAEVPLVAAAGDLFWDFVRGQGGLPNSHDSASKFFTDQGVASGGTYNDRLKKFMEAQGYTADDVTTMLSNYKDDNGQS